METPPFFVAHIADVYIIRNSDYVEEVFSGTLEEAEKRKDFLEEKGFEEWKQIVSSDSRKEYNERHVWTKDKYRVMAKSK